MPPLGAPYPIFIRSRPCGSPERIKIFLIRQNMERILLIKPPICRIMVPKVVGKFPGGSYVRKKLEKRIDKTIPISHENSIFLTAPSNPTILGHWMFRLEPFTTIHNEIENGSFEISSRLFKSISGSIEQVENNNSCWELPPEFYFQPEILININKIQDENVKDVTYVASFLRFSID